MIRSDVLYMIKRRGQSSRPSLLYLLSYFSGDRNYRLFAKRPSNTLIGPGQGEVADRTRGFVRLVIRKSILLPPVVTTAWSRPVEAFVAPSSSKVAFAAV